MGDQVTIRPPGANRSGPKASCRLIESLFARFSFAESDRSAGRSLAGPGVPGLAARFVRSERTRATLHGADAGDPPDRDGSAAEPRAGSVRIKLR